jgi:putative glutamine amidotransferase
VNTFIQPLIAITCISRTKKPPAQIDLYAEAVIKARGIPDLISNYTDPKKLAARYDGLLIPGGRDLPPSMYSETQSFPVDLEDEDRIAFELSFLDRMLRFNKPVLGICYGMQLINVFLGGTLYQDIASQVPGSVEHRTGMHLITIASNSIIAEGLLRVNSSHHQGVKHPGKGISPFAFSSDGVIEAFYSEDHDFLTGIQWHPERTDDDLSCLIFGKFTAACYVKKA